LVLFNGLDQNGSNNLMVYDSNTRTTWNFEYGSNKVWGSFGLNPEDFTAYNKEVYFTGENSTGAFILWATDGTHGGTHQVVDKNGASPTDNGQMAVMGDTLYFNGVGSDGKNDLMSYNAASNTFATVIAGGINPQDMASDGIELLFNSKGNLDIYNPIFNSSAPSFVDKGLNPKDITTDGPLTFFNGTSNGKEGLFYNADFNGNVEVAHSSGLNPMDITVLGNNVYFAGYDPSDKSHLDGLNDEPLGLWVFNVANPSAGVTEVLKSSNYELDTNPNSIAYTNPQAQISTNGTDLYFAATSNNASAALFDLNPSNNHVAMVGGTNTSNPINLTHV
jgi:hypothetical protein